MILFENLETAHKDAQEAIKPIRHKLQLAEKQYDDEAKEAAKPFSIMLEAYLNQTLQDKNLSPVDVGAVLILKEKKYKVVERGLQFVLGQMFDNSRCLLAPIRPDGTLGKSKSVYSSELKDYEIFAL